MINEKNSREFIINNKDRSFIFSFFPEHAKYITARMVLNSSFNPKFETHIQIQNVHALSEHGGTENLVICLGHNNALGAVINLHLTWSNLEDLDHFMAFRKHSIYRPEHVEREYRTLAKKVSQIKAQHVFVPTIPYPTIPPILRGVNSHLSSSHLGYFDYYSKFWIWDEDLNPEKHPHLTKDEAIQIDFTVDEYNHIIRKVAKENGWYVIPMAKHGANMAHRRLGKEQLQQYLNDFIAALQRNPLTKHLVNDDGKVALTTDFITADKKIRKMYKGCIFSLDSLHPTTIGYALMANNYRTIMKRAGVTFQKTIDWDYAIQEDTLVTYPPELLGELRFALNFLSIGNQEMIYKMGKSVFNHFIDNFFK